MSGVEAGITAVGVAGFLAGAFTVLLLLVAADTRRYGRRRRPSVDAARLEVRGGLFRVIDRTRPAASTAVTRKPTHPATRTRP